MKIKKGRRVIRSPLYESGDSPCGVSYSQNGPPIISTAISISTDSQCKGPYYVRDDSEKKGTPLTQHAGPSRDAAVDVYSSHSELSDMSYPSSKKSDIDRHSFQSPSQSYRVCSYKMFLHQHAY